MEHVKGSKNITIHLLNVQGFTRPKQIEIEELAKKSGVIVCLTETQQKYDKVSLTDGIKKVERRREIKDKKGGGILVAFKQNSWLKVEQIETKNPDVLYVVVKAYTTTKHMMVVYFSIPSKPEDKIR